MSLSPKKGCVYKKKCSSGFLVGRRSSASYVAAVPAAVALLAEVARDVADDATLAPKL